MLDHSKVINIENNIFHDNIFLVNFEWQLLVVLSRKPDRVLAPGMSLSSVFELDALTDIRRKLGEFIGKPFLVESLRGPAIIVNTFYHSTLMALVCFPDVDMATALLYADKTEKLIVCDSVRKKGFDHYGAPNPLKYSIIESSVERLTAPMLKSITFMPGISEDILSDMREIASLLSDLCGIKTEITVSGTLKRHNSQRYAADIDINLYLASLIHLLLLARHMSLDRRAKVHLGLAQNGEDPVVTVSFSQIFASDKQKTNSNACTFEKELFAIKSVFQRVNTLFTVSLEGEPLSVSFTPLKPDWSLLGIKNPKNELIVDVDFFDGHKDD